MAVSPQEPPPSTADLSSAQEEIPPTYLHLAHPETLDNTVSVRNKTQFSILSTVYAIPQAPAQFRLLNFDPPQRQLIHYELTFLSRHALRVRFSLDTRSDKADQFPDNLAFPPTHVREWLYKGHFQTPEEIEARALRDGKERMNVGLQLRGSDFSTWVNPQFGGGLEYQWVTNEYGDVGLEGFYEFSREAIEAKNSGKGWEEDQAKREKERGPLWKISSRGPFSDASMPAGVGEVEGQPRRCFELFELKAGENLSFQFAETKGPPPEEESPLNERQEDPEALFFWTDRGWGCLVKDPLPIKIDWLHRTRGPQIMLSVSTKSPIMEYIIVAGDALEKMKAEYGPNE